MRRLPCVILWRPMNFALPRRNCLGVSPVNLPGTECALYNYCNRLYLKANRNKGLVLLRKQQAVGQQAGAAAESALSSDPGEVRKIIAFR